MHVRGGDSCLKREQERMARTCNSLADYMVHAVRARELYGHGERGQKTTIFLATDTASVVADSKRAQWTKDFRFVHLSGVSRERPPHSPPSVSGLAPSERVSSKPVERM